MKLSTLSEAMWRRHANPLSVWSRLLSTPLVFVPLWNRSWRQGLGVAAWFAVNPFLFPEPKDPDGWAARAIRRERQWVAERPRDASLLIQSVGSAAMLAGLRFAYQRRLLPTALSTAVVMATNAWFLDRMARSAHAEPPRSRIAPSPG